MSSAGEFWLEKPLEQMNESEWESLCDGCGHCCVLRFQNEDTEEIYTTDVVCRFLDLESVQCSCYADRQIRMPECLVVTPDNARESWLPPGCAYRLVAEGKPLPPWHHLVSGDRSTIHEAGASVFGQVVSEASVHPDHIEERIQKNEVEE